MLFYVAIRLSFSYMAINAPLRICNIENYCVSRGTILINVCAMRIHLGPTKQTKILLSAPYTSCMRSPFPVVYARWSLIFQGESLKYKPIYCRVLMSVDFM